ncbi:DUF2252 domain-containing protein [Sebaldella sp. S0638]|uniref:DUF2252 domain-containing protein n=1 Tax=Sebaldella sp. S0638 TaxID=2957809 RepID=UPI0020A0451B|nr:DUF2252 domain-containing protein [Sebaldella sp. S0638]MCP1223163.1 DUF2252 domain-containing protein [Sebaldella sp. S0638]
MLYSHYRQHGCYIVLVTLALNMDNERVRNMQNNGNGENWKEIRGRVPRSSHAEWGISEERDPLSILRSQDKTRIEELVPIRYERMSVSPFTYFRGAAAVMAHDLSKTSVTGIHVQICGDAHIGNFGIFGSPEGTLLFDINDFDETIRGPWEWDLKRLAASIILGGESVGFGRKECMKYAFNAVQSYKETMKEATGMNTLDLWYTKIKISEIDIKKDKIKKRVDAINAKARSRTSQKAMEKFTHIIDGERKFIENPPIIEHVFSDEELRFVHNGMKSYRETISSEKRLILNRFRVVDIVRKVVGVGSVGTPCYAVLLLGKDDNDPLIMQVKGASKSVFEPYLKTDAYVNGGHRVVAGQRAIQAGSDIFLGWGKLNENDFYVRQLWNMKGSIPMEEIREEGFDLYGQACGKALAYAHANTGNRFAISDYLGKSDTFAEAVAEFAGKYADQTQKDHRQLLDAMENGVFE